MRATSYLSLWSTLLSTQSGLLTSGTSDIVMWCYDHGERAMYPNITVFSTKRAMEYSEKKETEYRPWCMRATGYFSLWSTLLSTHSGSLTSGRSDNVMWWWDHERAFDPDRAVFSTKRAMELYSEKKKMSTDVDVCVLRAISVVG